jgi:hypothetical protein
MSLQHITSLARDALKCRDTEKQRTSLLFKEERKSMKGVPEGIYDVAG